MRRFRSVGVLTRSSTGKTLRLEIHPRRNGVPTEERYYIYPDATQKVMEGQKKNATIYKIEE